MGDKCLILGLDVGVLKKSIAVLKRTGRFFSQGKFYNVPQRPGPSAHQENSTNGTLSLVFPLKHFHVE